MMRWSIACLVYFFTTAAVFGLLRGVNAYKQLTDAELMELGERWPPMPQLDPENGSLLSPLLIPRSSGTKGAKKALQFLTDFFEKELPEWELILDNFTDPNTPHGPINFANLIARRDPPGTQKGEVGRLVVAAHYDSKMLPEGFIGATDSAFSCAMMLYIAKIIDAALTAKWAEADGLEEDTKGIEMIFFDGEEAMVTWTATDSLFGARHLAEVWDETIHHPPASRPSELSSIDLFLLLDLLGAAGPRIPSYFATTHWAYKHLARLEAIIRASALAQASSKPWFFDTARSPSVWRSTIEDDHVPFMKRGVEVVHLIPTPFPGVWHTMGDDKNALDVNVCREWALVMGGFVLEWMEVGVAAAVGVAPAEAVSKANGVKRELK